MSTHAVFVAEDQECVCDDGDERGGEHGVVVPAEVSRYECSDVHAEPGDQDRGDGEGDDAGYVALALDHIAVWRFGYWWRRHFFLLLLFS